MSKYTAEQVENVVNRGSWGSSDCVKTGDMLRDYANLLREREAAFDRGYVRGYEAALGAAASECRRQAGALDHGGNEYIRYADAIKCAATIGGLRPPEVPELNELSGNSGQLPNGVYVIERGFQVERGQSIPTVLVGFGIEDWDARDAFASMLASAPKRGEG